IRLTTVKNLIQEITNLTYNNYGGFTMGLQSASTFTAICKHTSNTSSMTSFTAIDLAGYNSNLNRLITRQSAKEKYGAFYVFPYRTMLGGPITEGITDYISVTPSNILQQINPVYTYYSLTGNQDTFTASTQPCQITTYNLSNAGSNPTVFIQPIVSRSPFKDYFLRSLLSLL
ncbi:MAG: hypothetical protein EB040_00815, partial [Actinobacteria bacterium]|nr:hypothetical protein [Actinomycetota bacterium]